MNSSEPLIELKIYEIRFKILGQTIGILCLAVIQTASASKSQKQFGSGEWLTMSKIGAIEPHISSSSSQPG